MSKNKKYISANESITPHQFIRPNDKERQNSATPNKYIRPTPTPQKPKENK